MPLAHIDLKTRLACKARELGFELFGVAAIDDVPELARFDEWLQRGYAGEMSYLHRQRDRRVDPSLIVQDAKSVIACGINYHTENPLSIEAAPPASGWISRYAWGDDYHDVVGQKIQALYEFLCDTAQTPVNGRYYVDTGPVLEKVWAQYAGLGWIGKNTCLLNQKLGSFFFIALIITDLELPPDMPAVDRCGSCRRCIDACPTGAIVEPYVLDATRCISYLTIEKRGALPEAHREAMGRHVFGCDICQDICPWNQKAPVTSEPAFAPRSGAVNADLGQLLDMDIETFRQRFRKSPVKRAKYTGLLRNALIAAGNSRHEPLKEKIANFLDHEDQQLQEHARWAYRQFISPRNHIRRAVCEKNTGPVCSP